MRCNLFQSGTDRINWACSFEDTCVVGAFKHDDACFGFFVDFVEHVGDRFLELLWGSNLRAMKGYAFRGPSRYVDSRAFRGYVEVSNMHPIRKL